MSSNNTITEALRALSKSSKPQVTAKSKITEKKTNIRPKRINEALDKEIRLSDCEKLDSAKKAYDFTKKVKARWCFGYDPSFGQNVSNRFFDAYSKTMSLYGYDRGKDSLCFGIKQDGSVHGPYDINDNPVKVSILMNLNKDAEEPKEKVEESLNEDVASSMPAQPLPANQVKEFILGLPEATPNTPPRFFKLGYIKELTSEIPSRFRGGRGSDGQPYVRIFKCTEYSALYTGADWKSTNATKAADRVLGSERHTGERTGFSFGGENDAVNRIGTYRDGSEALQAYIADHSKQKVKYFISLDDEDLREASREEVAQCFTPAAANKLLTPGSSRVAAGVDDAGNSLYDKPINRFKLSNIYMIGNLGRSIM